MDMIGILTASHALVCNLVWKEERTLRKDRRRVSGEMDRQASGSLQEIIGRDLPPTTPPERYDLTNYVSPLY